MKLTGLFLLAIVLHVSAAGISQTVTVRAKDAPLRKLFAEIKAQTGYVVAYNNDLLKSTHPVTVSAYKMDLPDFLGLVLKNQPLTYLIRDKTILIYYREIRNERPEIDWAGIIRALDAPPPVEIRGKVTDEQGYPLPGVSIVIKGTQTGTTTDGDGVFVMNVPDRNVTLIFSFTGYLAKEVKVGNQTAFNVKLEIDPKLMGEVQVVGYGTQRKRDVTGSVASVSSKQIGQVAASSTVQAIQGRVSGVEISQDSWNPGAGSTVRIRGSRSITASNDPLYVIDGNPMTRGNITINDINPSDIESIEVLKDASATAIYGSRGANGVILITTKRGKSGKATISYDGYEGFQKPLNLIDVMDGAEYAEYVRDAYRNNNPTKYSSKTPNKDEDANLQPFKQDPYVLESVLMGYDENGNYDPSKVRSFDWIDAILQTGRIENHQISVSGGSDKAKIMVSGGYFGNKGLVKNMDYKRYNIRVNLDYQLSDRIKISTSSVISRVNEDIGTNLFDVARPNIPLASPYDADGKLVLNPGNDPLNLNPLLDIDGVKNDSRKDRIMTNLNLEAQLFKGLKYKANFGYDFRTTRDGSFQKSMSSVRAGKADFASYIGSSETDLLLENILYYDKTFGQDHRINVTLLQSVETNKLEQDSASADGLPYQSQEFFNIGSAERILSIGSNLAQWQMISYMARINYSLFDKYLFTLTGRQDGSSVLAPGRKYAFFPSAAFAWRASDEPFLKNSNVVNDLKVRVSYGKTGNSSIDPYGTQGSLRIGRYVWRVDNADQVIIGYGPGTMPNASLSWEATAQADLGIDFGLFNNRITGAIDVYQANTTGLLMPRKLPVVGGFEDVLTNVGKTRNTGYEINVLTRNIAPGRDFSWNTNFVFSGNKEEIVELIGGKVDDVGNGWFIGYPPVGTIYDEKVIGIWQDTEEDRAEMAKFNANGYKFEPGLIRVADINGDYKITADKDRVVQGSRRPKWTASLANDFTFRQFDLSFQIYASYGAIGNPNLFLDMNGRWNMLDVDYWREDNPVNRYPKPSSSWTRPDYTAESYIQDLSYVRLKFVTLGYTIPSAIQSRFGITRCRVYVSAQNPYLYTKFSGLDPEGARGLSSPSATTIMAGLNVTF